MEQEYLQLLGVFEVEVILFYLLPIFILLQQHIKIIHLPELYHDLCLLAADFLLYEIGHVDLVGGWVGVEIDLFAEVVEEVFAVDEAERVPILLIRPLLQEVVIDVLDVVVCIGVLEVLVQLELDYSYDGVPALLLHIQVLAHGLLSIFSGRIQGLVQHLFLHEVFGKAEVVYLNKFGHLGPEHFEDDDDDENLRHDRDGAYESHRLEEVGLIFIFCAFRVVSRG